jgi:hypothetical protein
VRVVRPGPAVDGHLACGWLFHGGDRFDRGRLLRLLGSLQRAAPAVARAKGVFRVAEGEWAVPSLAPSGGGGGSGGSEASSQVALSPVCYRGDSFAEVIVAAAPGASRGAEAGKAVSGAPDPGAAGGAAGEWGARVAAAVDAAGAGEFVPLEELFLGALLES